MASWRKIARRIRVPVGFAFAALYIWLARPTTVSILLGAALVLPGILIRALASGHVRKNEQLATTGPYAYTRNPLYLGSLVLAAGFAVAARSWWIAGILTVYFVIVYIPVIRGEEEFLRERFPEFAQYEQVVPRLLPQPGWWPGKAGRGRPRPYADSGGFSWALYCKHREYNALLGATAMLAALAVKMFWAK